MIPVATPLTGSLPLSPHPLPPMEVTRGSLPPHPQWRLPPHPQWRLAPSLLTLPLPSHPPHPPSLLALPTKAPSLLTPPMEAPSLPPHRESGEGDDRRDAIEEDREEQKETIASTEEEGEEKGTDFKINEGIRRILNPCWFCLQAK